MEDSDSQSPEASECDQTLETHMNTYSLPDSVLFYIFEYLTTHELINAGQTCKAWRQVSRDDLLWKRLFFRNYKIDPTIGILPGKYSWLEEYKRLTYHTPLVQAEVLRDHTNQVLHVSFAHDGTMFATCSKDGYILVWNSSHPVQLKYYHDMKKFEWKYTQFSQFNESDTLLLVSGVHFGTPHSTTGEIIVFSLVDGFTLQCRVMNKPYDIFGTWYSDEYFLSGDLTWLAHLVSCSVLTLNRASQQTQSEHVPVLTPFYRLYNSNASTVRAITVARCPGLVNVSPPQAPNQSEPGTSAGNSGEVRGNPPAHRDILMPHDQLRMRPGTSRGHTSMDRSTGSQWKPFCSDSIQYNTDYRAAEVSERDVCKIFERPEETEGEGGNIIENAYKYLIYATASRTYSPHMVAFKVIPPIAFPTSINEGLTIRERLLELADRISRERSPEPNWLNYTEVADHFDEADHLIDLNGHIIGMGVSPDHRYLYVNSRPWPQDCNITNPLDPPPIASEIDIHVIDLVTLKEVGTMLRAHKAYTPNNECFFIFLDVSNEYVASGAEDRHGYLWERHYGICLAKYPHSDVVNSVAFNPCDPEMLVTTSDDFTIRVWRSHAKAKELGLMGGNAVALKPRSV